MDNPTKARVVTATMVAAAILAVFMLPNGRGEEGNAGAVKPGQPEPTPAPVITLSQTPVAHAAYAPDPIGITIPAAGVAAPVVKTGLEPDGSLRVPPSPEQAGWYERGPKPGEAGASVITGHFDSRAGAGGMYNLRKAIAGDEIQVLRNDGSTAVFRVDRAQTYPQNEFPTSEVYGSVAHPSLRVITCAGDYNPKTQRYSHNLVVFASLAGIENPDPYQPL